MESQNIINLLDSNDNESQKFATKNGTLLMIKTLVIMVMVMVRMVLQLNLKLK